MYGLKMKSMASKDIQLVLIFVLLHIPFQSKKVKCSLLSGDVKTSLFIGKVLKNEEITTLTSQSLENCAKECIRRPRCSSFNYKARVKLCILNFDDSNSNLMTEIVSIFSPINRWNKYNVGSCWNRTRCDISERFTDGSSGPCQQSDCGYPPDIPGAEMTTLNPEIGLYSRIEYPCLPGYSLYCIATIGCQENGEWATDRFNCTYDGFTTDELTTDEVITESITTDEVTTDSFTTDEVTTDSVTIDEVTTDGVTTDGVTTDGVTTDGVTTDGVTNGGVTTAGVTSVDCGSPIAINNAVIRLLNDSTTYGSQAQYICEVGGICAAKVTMVNSSQAIVECQANGLWSSSSVECLIESVGFGDCTDDSAMIDVGFIIDDTNSISDDDYQKQLHLFQTLSIRLANITNCARVAVFRHHNSFNMDFGLDSFSTSSDACNGIRNLARNKGEGDNEREVVDFAVGQFPPVDTQRSNQRGVIFIVSDYGSSWNSNAGRSVLDAADAKRLDVVTIKIGGNQQQARDNHHSINIDSSQELINLQDECEGIISNVYNRASSTGNK